MKIIFTLLFSIGLLYSKQFGLVLSESRGITFDKALIEEIQSMMMTQNGYYTQKNSVSVFIDEKSKLKKDFSRKGSQSIVDFAISKQWDSIVLVDYKKSIQRLSFKLVVADKVQDRKSTQVIYNDKTKETLANVMLSNLLKLNYQLGVFNAKDLY